jgi:hypothetical protein
MIAGIAAAMTLVLYGPISRSTFVDRKKLRVDAGCVGGVGLVVVIDELHRPAEQPALRIDVVAPDLEADLHLPAGGAVAPVRLRHKPMVIGAGAWAKTGRRARAMRRDEGAQRIPLSNMISSRLACLLQALERC